MHTALLPRQHRAPASTERHEPCERVVTCGGVAPRLSARLLVLDMALPGRLRGAWASPDAGSTGMSMAAQTCAAVLHVQRAPHPDRRQNVHCCILDMAHVKTGKPPYLLMAAADVAGGCWDHKRCRRSKHCPPLCAQLTAAQALQPRRRRWPSAPPQSCRHSWCCHSECWQLQMLPVRRCRLAVEHLCEECHLAGLCCRWHHGWNGAPDHRPAPWLPVADDGDTFTCPPCGTRGRKCVWM
jgi:hypothetical protein